MSYTVLVPIDSAGKWPVVAEEDEQLFSDEGDRWRFVASMDDEGEAWRLVGQLHAKRQRGEL